MRFRVIALALAYATTLLSQVSTSRFGGTVQDASGGVIPRAGITCVNEGTGVRLSGTVGDDGAFLSPSLQPGLYTVTVEAPGFSRRVLHNYELTVAEIASEVITLAVGEASTSIDVAGSASATRVQTAEAQVSRVITLAEIDTLPQIGRDPMVLANQQPGIAYDGSFSRANGTRQGSTNTKLDGITAIDPVYPRLGLAMAPENSDSVAEFRIVLSGGKAEYGRNGGAQIEMISRSGGNRFSGNLFEYLRNTVLNANGFFNNASGVPVPKLIQNQFGGSLGGPLRRDKTFFFVNSMTTRARQEVVRNRLVLSPEAKRGLYRWRATPTGAVQSFDIARNDPRGIGIDPQVAKTLALLPEANNFDIGDGLNNGGYRFNNPSNTAFDQWTLKVDHNLRAGHRLFFRYSWGRSDLIDALNNADARYPGQPAGTQAGTPMGFSLGSDWNITPHSVNELRVGRMNTNVDFLRPARPAGPALLAPPTLYIDPVNPAFSSGRSSPVTEVTENLSVVRGSHTFKLGLNAALATQSSYNNNGIYPNVRLINESGNTPPAGAGPTNQQTFNDLYNVVLGRMSQVSLIFYSDLKSFQAAGTPQVRSFRYRDFGGFWQDDWRVTRRLSINVGVRWEYFGRPSETNGFQGRFENAEAIDGVHRASDLRVSPGTDWYNADWNNFAPRFGFVFDPRGDGRTAVRGAYGIFYDHAIGGLWGDQDSTTPGFVQSVTVYPNQAGGSDVRLSDGIPTPPRPAAPLLQLPATRSTSIMLSAPDLRTSYFQHLSLGVQREILRDTVLEAGYVGTRGVKLVLGRNVNQPRIYEDFLQAFREMQAYVTNGTPVPASNVLVRVAGSPAAAVTGFGASNFRLGLVGNVASALDVNAYPRYAAAGVSDFYLRNYPQFFAVALGTNDGRSYYDSVQVSLRRSARDLKLNLNYAFSKSIDNLNFEEDPVIDSSNMRLNRGRSNYDLPHTFNMGAIWRLPFGKGQRLGAALPGWATRVAGGWEIGMLQTVQSGYPFTAGSGRATTGATTVSTPLTTWADYTGDRSVGEVRRQGDGVYYFTPQEVGRFSFPAAGEIGNSGRNAFRGPRLWNMDLSLVRRFPLGEKRAVTLRGEFYNAWNHTIFANPTTSLASASFGKIGTTLAARRIQVAARWDF